MNTNFEYFLGRVCTIFTSPINRDFKQENPKTYPNPLFVYFIGFVEGVSEDGIWVKQLKTNCKSFFFFSHIVGIAEEQVLNPDDEKDMKVIEEFKEANKKKEIKKMESEFIDPDSISSIVGKVKN